MPAGVHYLDHCGCGKFESVGYEQFICTSVYFAQKKKGTTKKRKLKTAEIKLMITILYFFLIALYNITVATIALWRSKAL